MIILVLKEATEHEHPTVVHVAQTALVILLPRLTADRGKQGVVDMLTAWSAPKLVFARSSACRWSSRLPQHNSVPGHRRS